MKKPKKPFLDMRISTKVNSKQLKKARKILGKENATISAFLRQCIDELVFVAP